MNFIMSSILYNPMETLLLLLANKIFNNSNFKFNQRNLVSNIYYIYFISFINLIIQYITECFYETLLYMPIVVITTYILIPVFMFLVFKCKNFLLHYGIYAIYAISTIMIINLAEIAYIPKLQYEGIWEELYFNFVIKLIQFTILFSIKGVQIIMKKFLKDVAKQNLGKNVASTILSWGERKLSDKLKSEIKENK